MRPAHSAREIRHLLGGDAARAARFNEARAFSAGNPRTAPPCPPPACRFNEARAFSAGNLSYIDPPFGNHDRFNEARAFSAGNQPPSPTLPHPANRFNEARAFSAGNPDAGISVTTTNI